MVLLIRLQSILLISRKIVWEEKRLIIASNGDPFMSLEMLNGNATIGVIYSWCPWTMLIQDHLHTISTQYFKLILLTVG